MLNPELSARGSRRAEHRLPWASAVTFSNSHEVAQTTRQSKSRTPSFSAIPPTYGSAPVQAAGGEQTLPYTIGEGVPPAAALRTGADTSPHPCAFSRLLAHREFLRPERAATNQTIQRRLPLRTSAAFPRLQVQRSRAPQPATTCTPFGIRPPKFGIHRAPAQAPAHPDIGTLAEASCFEPSGREGKNVAAHQSLKPATQNAAGRRAPRFQHVAQEHSPRHAQCSVSRSAQPSTDDSSERRSAFPSIVLHVG